MQAKEARARPSCASDVLGDGGKGTIPVAAILVGTIEHYYLVNLAMPCAREPSAGFDGGCPDTARMALIFARLDLKMAQFCFGKSAQRPLLISGSDGAGHQSGAEGWRSR